MHCSMSDPRCKNSSTTVQDKDNKLHHNLHESLSPNIGIKSAEDFGIFGEANAEKIDDSDKEEWLARKAKVHKWFISFPDMTEAGKEKQIHAERYEPADQEQDGSSFSQRIACRDFVGTVGWNDINATGDCKDETNDQSQMCDPEDLLMERGCILAVIACYR